MTFEATLGNVGPSDVTRRNNKTSDQRIHPYLDSSVTVVGFLYVLCVMPYTDTWIYWDIYLCYLDVLSLLFGNILNLKKLNYWYSKRLSFSMDAFPSRSILTSFADHAIMAVEFA